MASLGRTQPRFPSRRKTREIAGASEEERPDLRLADWKGAELEERCQHPQGEDPDRHGEVAETRRGEAGAGDGACLNAEGTAGGLRGVDHVRFPVSVSPPPERRVTP